MIVGADIELEFENGKLAHIYVNEENGVSVTGLNHLIRVTARLYRPEDGPEIPKGEFDTRAYAQTSAPGR